MGRGVPHRQAEGQRRSSWASCELVAPEVFLPNRRGVQTRAAALLLGQVPVGRAWSSSSGSVGFRQARRQNSFQPRTSSLERRGAQQVSGRRAVRRGGNPGCARRCRQMLAGRRQISRIPSGEVEPHAGFSRCSAAAIRCDDPLAARAGRAAAASPPSVGICDGTRLAAAAGRASSTSGALVLLRWGRAAAMRGQQRHVMSRPVSMHSCG